MSMLIPAGLGGITLIPSNVPMDTPIPPPVVMAPMAPAPMMPPPPPIVGDPLGTLRVYPTAPGTRTLPTGDDMSLALQNAQASGVSRLSIGNILGGIAGAAGGFLTGGIGGAITGGVQGFTGGPKPKPGIGIQMGGTFIGMQYTPQNGKGGACGMRGYHLDKKTHMRWVKNRHMNFGNGRANSRAIRRLHGAERQLKRIFRVMHGKKVKVLPKARARGRR